MAMDDPDLRFHFLFESSRDGIVYTDLEGRILQANSAYLDMVGYSAAELTRMTYLQLTPPQWHGMEAEIVRDQILLLGYSEVYEKEYLRKDGTVLPVTTRGWLIRDEAGAPTGMCGIVRDITGPKRAEQRLADTLERVQHSEAKYRMLTEKMGEGLIATDAAGTLTYCNPRFLRLLGLQDREVLGKTFFELTANYDRENFLRRLRDRRQELGEKYDVQLRHRDGRPVETTVSAEPLFNDRGEFIGTLGIIADARDRKRHEAELRESEKRYKLLLDSVTDYTYTVHLDDGRPVSTEHGPGCAAVTGYRPEDYLGDADLWYRMIYEPDRAGVVEQTGRILAGGTVEPLEHRILHRDGSLRWVRNMVVPHYDGQGHLLTVNGLIQDITEKRRLEDQLRQAQKMEAIGQLAGGVAHDFNNILQTIMGYGNLAQMKLAADDPLQHALDQILAAANRAARLTQDLLAFSRKQAIHLQPLELNEIVKRVETLLQPVIGADIEFTTQLAESGLVIMADEGQIAQILINLATNARDAMPAGGALTIRSEFLELDETFAAMHGYGQPGRYALMTIADTGTGMDKPTRQRIFEPFYTTKEQGKGTGLGLSIVYGIVKQHGGLINVYSEPGLGTTFKIYLPLLNTAVVPTANRRPDAPPGGRETLLLAEDDAQVRTLTSSVLKGFGYRVLEAVDGQDALDQYGAHAAEIDLLILDVIMPKRSGQEVADAVRVLRPGANILFTSGYAADFIHARGFSEQGIQFISKPWDPHSFLKKLREILD